MSHLTRRRFGSALMAAAGASLFAPAFAQTYPAKVVKLIAPYPPGGGVDTVARLIAERLATRIGQPVTADLPVKNVQELIALAKSKPGQLSYASSGIGGLQHLNAEMFKQMAGVDLVHVPYKGTAQFLPDLMAGRVPMSVDSLPAHLPHIKSGKIRALAVATRARVPMLPDVPAMAEAGLPGYETATNYTLFAPTGTPRDAVHLPFHPPLHPPT